MSSRGASIVLLLAAFTALPAHAQSDAEVAAAVRKGRDYLLALQDRREGAFKDVWAGKGYRSGETALALLTLLQAEVPPSDKRLEIGFRWLLEQPIERIYDVSVAILALEARYMPAKTKSIQDPAPLASQVRKRFRKKASPRDRKWLVSAAAFLEKHQDKTGLWRYPLYGDADVSNAQFAVLALKAARRMGVKVGPSVFWRAAEALVRYQEQSGAKVPSFPVPAADRRIAGLLDRRAKAKKKKRKIKRRRTGAATREREEPVVHESSTVQRMHARGWGYKPGDGPRGSMTAAGLAILVVCKSELEDSKRYQSQLAEKVDRALRDGAGWLASNFAVDKNPGADLDWLFYYLYTLERAGTLLGLERFGGRSWYDEGARAILARQAGDGRFLHKTSGQADGDLAGTCLAILFLERSTVPVMKRVVTGSVAASSTRKGPSVKTLSDGQQEVTFRFRTLPGRRVTVAGSFNAWDKERHALRDTGNGYYEAVVIVPAGRQEYKFVVDGSKWQTDPSNPQGAPDGHGGQNSLVGR
jgi:hypothetical protein